MTRFNLPTLLIASAGLAPIAAADHLTQFAGMITGDQENPDSGSPATGSITGEYNETTNAFTFNWEITDSLIGDPSSPGAHLHQGAEGVNGPVVFGFNEPDGTWALSGSSTWSGLSTEQVAALFAGEIYANFHTTVFPGGEVRGQLFVVPAPASLVFGGVAGIGLLTRRRRPQA